MSLIDWIVLIGTLAFIIIFGIIKGRGKANIESYLLADKSMSWQYVLFSVMATQASAITFLSGPGQAFTDGMRFVQFYFGLPFAMILISAVFVPIFGKLHVYTAYEFLEKRFDVRIRYFTSFLFLFSRGLSTGISIYAPSIILTSLLGWNIYVTTTLMGGLVIIYTITGGAKAVSVTQKQQFLIIIGGMLLAGYSVVKLLPEGVGFSGALHLSGAMGKLNTIDTSFDLQNRYNIWSGLIGGFFLQLSYFGTDQSQVGRYLTGKDNTASKLGLLMNGIVKIPMQFMILLLGILVFAFYQFNPSPINFNNKNISGIQQTEKAAEFNRLQRSYDSLSLVRKTTALEFIKTDNETRKASLGEQLARQQTQNAEMRATAGAMIEKAVPATDKNDTNYIFLYFVLHHLPMGLIGLLIAIVFAASWNSCSAALNSLASCSIVDFYQRAINTKASDKHYFKASRWITAFWGVFCIFTAFFAGKTGSLIETVNILGSLFYGTILGVFLVGFFMKKIDAGSVLWAAVITEIGVIFTFYLNEIGIFKFSYLWLNVLGSLAVCIIAYLVQMLKGESPTLEKSLSNEQN